MDPTIVRPQSQAVLVPVELFAKERWRLGSIEDKVTVTTTQLGRM